MMADARVATLYRLLTGRPLAKAAEQLGLFSSGAGTIKQSGKNRLGVDKRGRTHWITNVPAPIEPAPAPPPGVVVAPGARATTPARPVAATPGPPAQPAPEPMNPGAPTAAKREAEIEAPVVQTRLTWGTPLKSSRGLPEDLRQQVTVGDLVIGNRYDRDKGLDIVEFGRITKVLRAALDIERPDGTKARITHKLAVYRTPTEKANAEAVLATLRAKAQAPAQPTPEPVKPAEDPERATRRAAVRAEVAELKDRWRRHEAWCEDFAQQAVQQRKPIRWDSASGLEYLLVTRDTHPDSLGWRVTRFDPRHGPTGHTTGATPGKALLEALTSTQHRDEVRLAPAAEFDAMTRTPEFLHGMRRVGLLQQLNRLVSLSAKPENEPKQEQLAVHWRHASDALAAQDLDTAEQHLRAGLEHGRIVKAVLFCKARRRDVVTMPRDELIEEHEHLLGVLRSPSRTDDKREAKKQARELAAYRRGKRKRLVLKAHIKAFSRTNPKTGQTIQVREHEDKRMAARLTVGTPRQAAAVPAPPAPRYPAPQQQPQHRYATIHTAGPDSPGHAVRLQPHPQKAGVWQLHPDDKERVRHLMTPSKPGQQQPAPQPQTVAPAPQASPAVQTPQMAEPKSPPPPGQFYAPDPTHSTHPTGVADAARVGVPAMNVPPPPSEIPRLPNLAPDERRAEEAFATAFEADPDGVARRYLDALTKGEVGDAANIFATDDAKVLSGDWNPQGVSPDEVKVARSLYNTAVHQTANAIAKRAFMTYLDNLSRLPEHDAQRHVLVTAGGVAAGKGYALANIGEVNTISKMVGAVWDSAGEQNSTELPWVLEECRKRKLKMTAVYVHSDPSQTWENPERGVVERAQKKGRMVDARVFADSYTHGAHNFKAFADHVAVNNAGDVSIYFIDNTTAKPTLSSEMPSAALTLDPEALYHRSLDYLQRASVGGHIKRGGASGTRIWGPPQVGRHGQPQRGGQANQQAAPGASGPTPPQPGGQPQAA